MSWRSGSCWTCWPGSLCVSWSRLTHPPARVRPQCPWGSRGGTRADMPQCCYLGLSPSSPQPRPATGTLVLELGPVPAGCPDGCDSVAWFPTALLTRTLSFFEALGVSPCPLTLAGCPAFSCCAVSAPHSSASWRPSCPSPLSLLRCPSWACVSCLVSLGPTGLGSQHSTTKTDPPFLLCLFKNYQHG